MSEALVAERLAELRIEPGLWERTTAVTDVRAELLPRELLERLRARGGTTRNCIFPEQAARPAAQFLAGRENARCETRRFAMENGRMTGEMLCVDPRSGGQWTARLDGRYAARRYELDLAIDMPSPFDPGQLAITSRVTGRHVGACPADSSQQEKRQ